MCEVSGAESKSHEHFIQLSVVGKMRRCDDNVLVVWDYCFGETYTEHMHIYLEEQYASLVQYSDSAVSNLPNILL